MELEKDMLKDAKAVDVRPTMRKEENVSSETKTPLKEINSGQRNNVDEHTDEEVCYYVNC